MYYIHSKATTMPEYLDYFARHYGLLAVCAVGLLKLFHLVLYRGFNVVYIVSHFFKIYDRQSLDHRFRKRRLFRRWHNVYTYSFYFFIVLWFVFFAVLANS